MRHKPVAIIMGSKSDFKTMKDAVKVLRGFGIRTHVEVVSAHRTPERMAEFGKSASTKYSIVIAGAGGAAHLPGMVASYTTLPVIGVPVTINPSLKGLDALLSIVQMPKGIPVATVAVGNSANAGLLAARILSVNDSKLQRQLEKLAGKLKLKVKTMNKEIKKFLK